MAHGRRKNLFQAVDASYPVAQFLKHGVQHLATGLSKGNITSPYGDRSRSYHVILLGTQVFEDLVHVICRVFSLSSIICNSLTERIVTQNDKFI